MNPRTNKPSDIPAHRRARLFTVIAFLAGLALSVNCTAQLPTSAPDAAQDESIVANRPTNESANSGIARSNSSNLTLSAQQILRILQNDPEVVIELKGLVADLSEQQGTPIQADSISDDMLYSQIISSSELRSSITAFLRARGYVSNTDQLPDSDSGPDSSDFPVSMLGQNQKFALPPQEVSSASRADTLSRTAQDPETAKRSEMLHPQQSIREKDAKSTTDRPQVLHRSTPYNLLSLRDLYTQIPNSYEPLRRFGSDVFVLRDANSAERAGVASKASLLEIPVRPDYVLGPGDGLTIDIWGGMTQTVNRVVDRDGHIMLPEAGEVQIAGQTLERAQAVIAGALKNQFRNAQVAVTVSRLRTIRVYVVGDVQRPGAYDISALSSPLGALFAAGGPTAVGSLRALEHLRGGKQIDEIDLYDFLLHGVQARDDRLEGGDTLLVPPAGPQIAVYGAVKRAAIYELLHENRLGALIEEAGGVTVAAALGHVTVERIDPNQRRQTLSLELPSAENSESSRRAIEDFEVKDGDRISVAPVLPHSENVIYLEGHVARPGRLAYRDGMRLSDVLKSYRDLLPEPATQGEIVRLTPPDLHVDTIDFDVPDALIGNANLALQPFDTIRIFGRYEQDPPNVTVRGEVLRPGSYPLSEGMSAAGLIRMAGGFKRDALLADADLISYRVVNGDRVEDERRSLQIGDAVLKADRAADVALKSGDVLTVHKITGWDDIGASIIMEGEVAHPGSYGIQQGEHLSDLLRRAGGFRDTAYPEGAVFTRPEVKTLEEKSREELIRQIETSSAAARLTPNIAGGDQSAALQQIQQQQEQVLGRLRSQPATGRLVIHVSADIASWAGTVADIEVRSGDVLRVPKRPGFVLVTGQVYNSTAITFTPHKTASWYLQRAGGATEAANRKEIFIIRANGSVIGRRSGGWREPDVLSTKLGPGDVIVVPQKIVGASIFWRNLLSTAQIAASIAITAAVAGL